MMTYVIILSALGFLLGLSALVYSIHVAIVYNRFNDSIKDWSQSLDESTFNAINSAARRILTELDSKISEADTQVNDINE